MGDKKVPDDIRNFITSVLVSRPKGVMLSRFQRDYSELVGERLNCKKYGFASLTDLFETIPDAVRIEHGTNGTSLHGIPKSEAYQNIAMRKAKQANDRLEVKAERPKNMDRDPDIDYSDPKVQEWLEDLVPNMRNMYALCFPRQPEHTRELVSSEFAKFGDVAEVSMTDRNVFIRFRSETEALRALVNLHKTFDLRIPHEKMNPRFLIKNDLPKPKKRDGIDVYVGNLPAGINKRDIITLLKYCQIDTDIIQKITLNNVSSKGYTFLTVDDRGLAEDLIQAIHNKEWQGRRIACQFGHNSIDSPNHQVNLDAEKMERIFSNTGVKASLANLEYNDSSSDDERGIPELETDASLFGDDDITGVNESDGDTIIRDDEMSMADEELELPDSDTDAMPELELIDKTLEMESKFKDMTLGRLPGMENDNRTNHKSRIYGYLKVSNISASATFDDLQKLIAPYKPALIQKMSRTSNGCFTTKVIFHNMDYLYEAQVKLEGMIFHGKRLIACRQGCGKETKYLCARDMTLTVVQKEDKVVRQVKMTNVCIGDVLASQKLEEEKLEQLLPKERQCSTTLRSGAAGDSSLVSPFKCLPTNKKEVVSREMQHYGKQGHTKPLQQPTRHVQSSTQAAHTHQSFKPKDRLAESSRPTSSQRHQDLASEQTSYQSIQHDGPSRPTSSQNRQQYNGSAQPTNSHSKRSKSKHYDGGWEKLWQNSQNQGTKHEQQKQDQPNAEPASWQEKPSPESASWQEKPSPEPASLQEKPSPEPASWQEKLSQHEPLISPKHSKLAVAQQTQHSVAVPDRHYMGAMTPQRDSEHRHHPAPHRQELPRENLRDVHRWQHQEQAPISHLPGQLMPIERDITNIVTNMMRDIYPSVPPWTTSDVPDTFDVVITCIMGSLPLIFWGQIICEESKEDLKQLLKIQNEIKGNVSPYRKGQRHCVAMCGEWRRAYVMDVLPDNLYRVFFIDYGNCLILKLSELGSVADRYWILPPQALPFRTFETYVPNVHTDDIVLVSYKQHHLYKSVIIPISVLMTKKKLNPR